MRIRHKFKGRNQRPAWKTPSSGRLVLQLHAAEKSSHAAGPPDEQEPGGRKVTGRGIPSRHREYKRPELGAKTSLLASWTKAIVAEL